MNKNTEDKAPHPEIPKFSLDYMDPNKNPFVDFYGYACGNWFTTHPIPEDKTRWGAFNELIERNTYVLRDILEECSKSTGESRSSVKNLLGKFYISSMDETAVERLGFSPINDLIAMVDNIKSVEDMKKVIPRFHSIGIPCFFDFYAEPDEKNSEYYALHIYQGGISLPDREYYINDSFSKLREEYEKHIQNMFLLLRPYLRNVESYSSAVIRIEKYLAQNSRARADLRDAEKNYNKVNLESQGSKYKTIDIQDYFISLKVPRVQEVIIRQPEFFEALDGLFLTENIENLKIYLLWKILNFAAPYIHSAAYTEHFEFFNKKLLGQERPEPRWKRSVSLIDMLVGEALGQLYVEKEFGESAKRRMAGLVEDIKAVFLDRLRTVAWMSETTGQRAVDKFTKLRTKIGYPKHFRDYSSIEILEGDFFGNILRSNNFEIRRQLDRVGSPVDKDEWLMSPPTVNAYFNPTENEIVFPAGILQPPFFDDEMDDAVNYGAIGAVISHEITHGFDDQGRRFDGNGNLNEWWTEEDVKRFTERAKKVVELYSSQEIFPGVHINGELTLGENIADLGGVSIAFEAFQRHKARHPSLSSEIEGMSPEQRFFISYAQIWRANVREQEARRLITIDPHSPDRFRAIIPAMNHEAFENVFRSYYTPDGTSHISEKIKVW